MELLNTTTVSWIVAISVLTSIVASYAAFSFAERVADSTGSSHYLWLTSGAASLGLGIWSMHYLGMLAVRLPIEVTYHVPTVLLSLVFALLASVVALEVVSTDTLSARRQLGGSILMGAGIGAMHYSGMHAMRCAAMHRYDLRVVALSVVIAVAFSYVALEIAFNIRRNPRKSEWLRVGGATVMGLGIAAMHYTAMTSVSFERSSMDYSLDHTMHVSTIGAVAVALTMSLVLFGALLSTVLDRRIHRRMSGLLDQIAEERDRFQAAAESSMDALYMCSAIRGPDGEIQDFLIQYANSNFQRRAGLPPDRIVGSTLSTALPYVHALGLFDRYKQVAGTGIPLIHELSIDYPNAKARWMRIQAVKLRDGVAVTASDITSSKEYEERILHLAHHDALTGLLNRALLRDRIQQAIDQARRHHVGTAVFLIDLDGFKQVNDSFGHAAGDFVLVTVAHRLKTLVRSTDSVMRIGGDEFVVVVTDLPHYSHACLCAEKLASAFDLPIQIEQQILPVTCSIGGAVYPDSAIDPDALLHKADLAMYRAKQRGKNRVQIDELEAIAS